MLSSHCWMKCVALAGISLFALPTRAEVEVHTNKVELKGGLEINAALETNLLTWIKWANEDFGSKRADHLRCLWEALPFTTTDMARISRRDAIGKLTNWISGVLGTNRNVIQEAAGTWTPVDVVLGFVETNRTDGVTFRLRGGEEVGALYRATNVLFSVVVVSGAGVSSEPAMQIVTADTEKYRKQQQEAFVKAVIAMAISKKPISLEEAKDKLAAVESDVKLQTATLAQETAIVMKLGEKKEELLTQKVAVESRLADYGRQDEVFAKSLGAEPTLLRDPKGLRRISDVLQRSVGFEPAWSTTSHDTANRTPASDGAVSNAAFRAALLLEHAAHDAEMLETFEAELTRVKSEMAAAAKLQATASNKLASAKAHKEDVVRLLSALEGSALAEGPWTVNVYNGVYTPRLLPSRIATEVAISILPTGHVASVTNEAAQVARLKKAVKGARANYLGATLATAEEGEELAKVFELEKARLDLAQAELRDLKEKESKQLTLRTKDADVGRPAQWSFGLAYSVSDKNDVEFSIDDGKVDAKKDTKNPVFLTANWDWWKTDWGLDMLNDQPPKIETSLMLGFRVSVEQMEPLVGLGAGFRLPWVDVALRLWGGAAYVSKNELKGDANPGEDAAANSKLDDKREVEWLWGVSADWRL